jgi:ACT domain-containing protein
MATKKKELIQLGVLVDTTQMKAIDKAAKSVGLSRSAYVRFVLMQHIIKVK